jgi:hypothetical protein
MAPSVAKKSATSKCIHRFNLCFSHSAGQGGQLNNALPRFLLSGLDQLISRVNGNVSLFKGQYSLLCMEVGVLGVL